MKKYFKNKFFEYLFLFTVYFSVFFTVFIITKGYYLDFSIFDFYAYSHFFSILSIVLLGGVVYVYSHKIEVSVFYLSLFFLSASHIFMMISKYYYVLEGSNNALMYMGRLFLCVGLYVLLIGFENMKELYE